MTSGDCIEGVVTWTAVASVELIVPGTTDGATAATPGAAAAASTAPTVPWTTDGTTAAVAAVVAVRFSHRLSEVFQLRPPWAGN